MLQKSLEEDRKSAAKILKETLDAIGKKVNEVRSYFSI